MRAPLLVALLSLVGVFASCKTPCDAKSCSTGCCDATGTCQSGITNLACGSSAATCQVCGAGTSCNLGLCSLAGSGGGTGTGGGSGGGSGGSGGGGGGSSALTQLCTDYANAYVDRAVRCGSITDALGAYWRPVYMQDCLIRPPPGLADGRSEINQTAAQTCIAELTSSSCLQSAGTACDNIVRGLVGLNGDCYGYDECQDAFYCDTTMACPGKCLARVTVGQTPVGAQLCVKTAYVYDTACVPLIAHAQSCAPMGGQTETQSCARPEVCTATEVCGPMPLSQGLNESCAMAPCGEGLQCVANVCVAYVNENGACDSVRHCKQGLACSPANACVAITLVALGETCGGYASCQATAFCNVPQGATQGTCAARRPVNGTCSYSGSECAAGLYCTATSTSSGICKVPGVLNDPCSLSGSYNQCSGGLDLYCTATSTMMSGVCANRKGEGATCASSDECQGSCLSMRCTRPPCYDPTP